MSNQNLKVDHKTVIEEFKRKHNYLVDGFNLETVHKMPAPTSTTLTDSEISQIIDGVFTEGTFAGYTNPVLFPAKDLDTIYSGMYIAIDDSGNKIIGNYAITKSSKNIAFADKLYIRSLNGSLVIKSLETVNEKNIPLYPASDVSKYFKCENGTLKWEDINLADIVDSQGNKRFVEGDINLIDNIQEGITKVYGKWSLSGSHLLIVVSVNFANETAVTSGSILCQINVPQWILDKIIPLISSYVTRTQNTLYGEGLTTQSMNISLRKDNTYGLYISLGSLTLNADRNCRIAYDLLIDTDAPVSAGE